MTEEEAGQFDAAEEQIVGMYEEIGLLSKKKPDSPVNEFKLRFVNELITKVNNLLGTEYSPLAAFDGFDTDAVPTASDVVFVLAQYLKSMNRFRHDHTEIRGIKTYWVLEGQEELEKATKASTFLR